jgi:hypothetical protein
VAIVGNDSHASDRAQQRLVFGGALAWALCDNLLNVRKTALNILSYFGFKQIETRGVVCHDRLQRLDIIVVFSQPRTDLRS